MLASNLVEQTHAQQAEIPMQRQWPQLGRELFTLEQALTETVVMYEQPLTDQEKLEKRERIRDHIIDQLYLDEETYSRDERYRALLLVKQGRGAEIVGNPYYVGKNGKKQELPYTGLEGYYAGSERTSAHPGITREEIIQEEAKMGVELLRTLKKHYIEKYSWASFAKMKKALEGGEPDIEDLRKIRILWTEVVRKLHVRVYNNKEFDGTITEQIEQLEKLLSGASARTEEEKAYKSILQAEYERLKKERNNMSEEEKEKERKERRKRESIRTERLKEYRQFREETYEILKEAKKSEYAISVQDTNWEEANIIEIIRLPKTRDRNDYPLNQVKLTPEQLEGYLFLARLGEIGGDPLTRSVLASD